MYKFHQPVRIVWLNANGCYAVAYGDQLLSMNGQTLFQYKWQLEKALDVVDLVCLDFEGNGIVTVKEKSRNHEKKGWLCPGCQHLLYIPGKCHVCGHP